MKFYSSIIISSILAATVSGAAFANEGGAQVEPQGQEALAGYDPSPFDLAFLAYRGYFKEQGIPSYSYLCQQLRMRQIDGWDIVNAAVAAGRLDAGFADDEYADNVRRLVPCRR
jgi:ABC-type nitrate/sulfonate/bicarbonate transport system substrate-binding protein